MTNDSERDPTTASAGSGGPPAPDPIHAQSDPTAPSDSFWSRPTRDPSGAARSTEPVGSPPESPAEAGETRPAEPVQPQATPPGATSPPSTPWTFATPAGETPTPNQSSSPWPPAAAAQSSAGYPTPPYQPPPYQPPYPGQPMPPAARTNPLAVVALVCSLVGLATGIAAPVGAVLGHVALRQIRQTGEEGSSLAKAAIWVGWIITGLIVLVCCAGVIVGITTSQNGSGITPR